MSNKTNWGQSVTAVVVRDDKVLLARHTYGNGKGMLIIPGGYVNEGESPYDAVIREFKEETSIVIKPENIIGIRFNTHDWYVAFSAEYVSGTAKSDNEENSEVLWLEVNEALSRDDVPFLTKSLIKSALSDGKGLRKATYNGNEKWSPQSLYRI